MPVERGWDGIASYIAGQSTIPAQRAVAAAVGLTKGRALGALHEHEIETLELDYSAAAARHLRWHLLDDRRPRSSSDWSFPTPSERLFIHLVLATLAQRAVPIHRAPRLPTSLSPTPAFAAAVVAVDPTTLVVAEA